MQGKEYQQLAMRTKNGKCNDRLITKLHLNTSKIDIGGVLNGALGLSGEVGETLDMIKKWVFHEKELDTEHLKKELGDIMWYMAKMCHSFEFDLDEILKMNIDKLRARYPEGFSVERANNRAENDI